MDAHCASSLCMPQKTKQNAHTRAYAFKLFPAEKNSSKARANAAENNKVDAGLRAYLLLFQLSVILDAHSSVRRYTERQCKRIVYPAIKTKTLLLALIFFLSTISAAHPHHQDNFFAFM